MRRSGVRIPSQAPFAEWEQLGAASAPPGRRSNARTKRRYPLRRAPRSSRMGDDGADARHRLATASLWSGHRVCRRLPSEETEGGFMTVTLDKRVDDFITTTRQLFIDGRWV